MSAQTLVDFLIPLITLFIWCDTSVGYEEREIGPSAFQRMLAALLEGAERIQSEH